MKRPLDQLAEIAQKAVGIGSELIRDTRPNSVIEKSDRDTFTDIDLTIERHIRNYLSDTTPEIGFFGEEEGRSNIAPDSEYVWILDPIDGTANFVHGVPLCATQLALVHNGTGVVAAISLPSMNRIYWAADSLGAYVNGKRIHASGATSLSQSIVSVGDFATGDGAKEKNERRIALSAALAENVERVRMFGSAAHDLAWVAEGRLDGAIILGNKSWDVAAGALICREAGAMVLDRHGNQHSDASLDTIAATRGIASNLVDLVPE